MDNAILEITKPSIIDVDGSVTEVEPAEGGNTFSLKDMQRIVGGYIEMVPVGKNYMIVNEEGKMMGLPFNTKATQIFQSTHGAYDEIVGTVLVAPKKYFK